MAKLFPFRPAEGPDVEREPWLVNIDDEAADDVFAALSSDTARAILQSLYDEPTTASEVAEAVDTSLQNARYHLEKLQTAGLVEEIDTWYSSRGTEMTVYGPTSEPLVVAAGEEESRSILRNAIKRVVGAVGILGIASVMIDRLATSRLFPGGPEPIVPSDHNRDPGSNDPTFATDGGPTESPTARAAETTTPQATAQSPQQVGTEAGGDVTGSPTPQDAAETAVDTTEVGREVSGTVANTSNEVAEQATTTATDVAPSAGLDLVTASPGISFFAGGLLVVGLAAGWWYLTRYRPLYME